MSLYELLALCFDTQGILYEKKQNELLYEIQRDLEVE